MGLDVDLRLDALRAALGERPVRSYPALLSTEAEALAWARADAPHGAVVVAGYQVAPRGRAGRPWTVRTGVDLAFSLVLRPRLPADREGWIYVVATAALADVTGADTGIEWPDEIVRGAARLGAVSVQTELGPVGTEWAVVTLLLVDAPTPRAETVARLVAAVDHRLRSPSEVVLGDYLPRCATIGRIVRARLLPLGPTGPEARGRARDCRADGSLVVETDGGRVAVPPQDLGVLEEAEA